MQSEELVFRAYRSEDKATILSLLAGSRPATYMNEKLAVFDWQFFGNPRAGERSPFIVGTIRDKIVAVNGLMPVRARVRNQPVDACWSLDTYVSGEYRGKGFGKALIEQVSVSAPIMLGYGISDMSDPIFARSNWVLDGAMETYFYYSCESGWKGRLKNLACKGLRLIHLARHATPGVVITPEAQPSIAEIDALWQRVAPQYPNAVERDGPYMVWRYGQAPVLPYRWVAARSRDGLQAILVTRRHPVESVIVDYIGPLDQPHLLAGLMGVARDDLVAGGTKRVRCEANHPEVQRALRATGFRRYRQRGRFRVRSNLDDVPADAVRWFVMSGDSDNDLFVL